ncbi:urotensin 2, alpha [Boleophthalmus pectinirostris]|nr:urotensin 2, alpha [Boleophthalmus pectinirostris]
MNHLVSWAFLLVSAASLLAHPITDSAEMPYQGPVSVEEHALGTLDELSLSEPPDAAAALRLSTLLPVDISRDDLRTTGLFPRALSREVRMPPLVPQAAVFSPLSHVLGIRKHFRKRAGTADCFWKYCV